MKKLLLLTTLFLAFACSKDDEGENNEENQTFLQKYDGFGYTDGEEYWFFYDDNIYLRYVEIDEPNRCVEIMEGANTSDDGEFTTEILTNNSGSLLVEITPPGEENGTESLQFTVDSTGNNLTLIVDGDSEDPYSLRKTATTYSSLCN